MKNSQKIFWLIMFCQFAIIPKVVSQTNLLIFSSDDDSIYVWRDSTFEINLKLKNISKDTIIVYNFGNDWFEIVDESVSISNYSPGFWGNWNPGINIILYQLPDMTGYSMGKRMYAHYSDPEYVDKKSKSAITELLNSKLYILPNDSVSAKISYSFKNLGISTGTYLLRSYYEMNNQIYKYVPMENSLLLTRVKCQDIVLVIK